MSTFEPKSTSSRDHHLSLTLEYPLKNWAGWSLRTLLVCTFFGSMILCHLHLATFPSPAPFCLLLPSPLAHPHPIQHSVRGCEDFLCGWRRKDSWFFCSQLCISSRLRQEAANSHPLGTDTGSGLLSAKWALVTESNSYNFLSSVPGQASGRGFFITLSSNPDFQ